MRAVCGFLPHECSAEAACPPAVRFETIGYQIRRLLQNALAPDRMMKSLAQTFAVDD
jgi:hypothetical protein